MEHGSIESFRFGEVHDFDFAHGDIKHSHS